MAGQESEDFEAERWELAISESFGIAVRETPDSSSIKLIPPPLRRDRVTR